MPSSTTVRRGARLLVAFVAALICCLGSAGSAGAISAPIHIHGTGSDGLYLRPSPDTSQPAVAWMAEGTSPDYNCFTYGQMVGNVNVWFKVNFAGKTGYYASYYDDSSYHSEAELTSKYSIPKCGSAPAPTSSPTPSPSPAPTPAPAAASTPAPSPIQVSSVQAATSTPSSPAAGAGVAPALQPCKASPYATSSGNGGGAQRASAGYDRDAAVAWAKKHAQDKPYDSTSCTWFISQALWQGGLAKTAAWTSEGPGHGHLNHEPGTTSAFYTPDLARYILNTYPRSTYRLLHLGPSGNAVPDAQIGDVITYDWNGDTKGGNLDGLDHAAFITRIDGTQYPFVSEWSADGAKALKYSERGWTFSKLHGVWLADEPHNDKMRAYLLHIDTRPLR